MQTSENRDNRGRRDWLRWAALCARIALGAAFLSGIADRFGLYRGRNVGYGDFAGFVRYTAKVNSFMPPSTAATIAELFFGITLILGIWRVWVALGSAVLLILFGTAWRFRSVSSRRWITRSSRQLRLRCSLPLTRVGARSENEPASRAHSSPQRRTLRAASNWPSPSICRFVAGGLSIGGGRAHYKNQARRWFA